MQRSDTLYFSLMKMQLILDGAIARYEDEGIRINQHLCELERDGLTNAFSAIGEALYLVRDDVRRLALHDLDASQH